MLEFASEMLRRVLCRSIYLIRIKIIYTFISIGFSRDMINMKTSRKDAIKRVAHLSLGLSFGLVIGDKAIAAANIQDKSQKQPSVSQQSDIAKTGVIFRTTYRSLCYDSCDSYASGYNSTAGVNYSSDYYCQKNSYFYCTTNDD